MEDSGVVARAPARSTTSVHRSYTDEADGYAGSVEGLDIDAVRAGTGERGTDVLTSTSGRLAFNAGSVGFPMFSRSTVPDAHVMIAHVSSAAAGCRWCGLDLAPGMVVAYAPGAEHVSRSLPGLTFSFAITEESQLAEMADTLGFEYEAPPSGEVHQLAATWRIEPVRVLFRAFAAQVAAGGSPSSETDDELLRAMVHALSETDRIRRVGSAGRIDSRHVVHTCIDYALALGRIPSVAQLCAAAHVSERRLRTAFIAEFEVPPARFFRIWALDRAHRRLTHDAGTRRTVTEIATDLGLDHLGRFAIDYKRIFGEPPSATLDRNRRESRETTRRNRRVA